jgi:ribokinase
VQVDAVVGSASDPKEHYADGALDPPPGLVVRTASASGGTWVGAEGRTGTWKAAAPPAAPRDAYGCGDSFAAGLTYALGHGRDLDDALALAARCGACCLTGRGPYERQLHGPA